MIKLHGVSKEYRSGDGKTVRALDGINLHINEGEYAAVVGQSGSGKSTLMNIIGCLDVPSSGTYTLNGTPMGAASAAVRAAIRNREVGFVFQGFNLAPGLSALENVELPLVFRGMTPARRRALAADALERVGLGDRMHHRPGQLSGGQQQRVAIARALAARPPLILADEPTGNLDRESGEAVLGLIGELWKSGHTVLLITHDAQIAASAPRCIHIRDGRINTARLYG